MIKLNITAIYRSLRFLFCLLICALFTHVADAQTKKIVFLAGPSDHGNTRNGGSHQYEKDLGVLAKCLQNSPNLKGITTKMYVGKAPSIDSLKDASVIVILSSSDRTARETHPVFPTNASTNGKTYKGDTAKYLSDFDKLLRSGTGLVVLHYAIYVENWKAREYYINWFGGLWIPENYSNNPLGMWTMVPVKENEKHPILNGIKPFTYTDEVFSKFLVPAYDPKRTDLLRGTASATNMGAVVFPVVTSWAYQRPDGRAFIYGGVHAHAAMQNDDYRKFLLNGIIWAAGMEVPKGGVQSTVGKDE